MRGMAKLGVASALVLGGSVLPGIVPVGGAEIPRTATLTVTKTVVGPAPADAEFVIHVLCTRESETLPTVDELASPAAIEVVYDEDITFGASGGSEDFTFTRSAQCTVTETDDGGAASSSGGGTVMIDEPVQFDSEIVNTFVATATTQAVTTTTVASMAVTQPRFTG